MKKALLLNEIIDSMHKLNKLGEGQSGSVLIHGDADNETASATMKGNPEILTAAFAAQMDNNPEFNQLMMSMFGSYLTQHPAQKEAMFMGLQLSDLSSNMN